MSCSTVTSSVSCVPRPHARRQLLASLLWATPGLALAQAASPFMTGATALQTNILAWLTPIAVILVMVLGAWRWQTECAGAGVSARFLESPSPSARRRSWPGCAACSACRCHVSARNAGVTADPLFVGATRPPMRWGVTYAALLFNLVFTFGGVSRDQESADPARVRADPRRVRAAVRAGRALLRPAAAVGAHARCPAMLGTLRLWRASSYSPLSLDLPDARGRRRRAGPVRGWAGDRLRAERGAPGGRATRAYRRRAHSL